MAEFPGFMINGIDMVVIDDGICSHEPKEPVFSLYADYGEAE